MKRLVIILGALLVLTAPIPALAFVPRAGQTVIFSESLEDDLYIAGGTVDVTGTVDGDVVAAGGTVTLSGPASGGILAAGGTVRITSAIGRSLRAAAGDLTVGGRIGTDAVLAGGSVMVDQASQVGRDLVAMGGSVRVLGSVSRNAFLNGGDVIIGGTIQGNVEVQADHVTLLPSARIQGQLRYSADRPAEIQSGAQVTGGIERTLRPTAPWRYYRPFAFRFAGRVMEALWLLAIGFVALAVAPRGVPRVVERVSRHFGMSLLTGFILLVVVPVAALLVAFTLIGIPLSIAAVLLYLATLYPGQIFPALWLGEWIMRNLRRGGAPPSPYLAMTVGVILFAIAVAVPFIGWLLRLVALLAGFGALWAAVWATRAMRQAA